MKSVLVTATLPLPNNQAKDAEMTPVPTEDQREEAKRLGLQAFSVLLSTAEGERSYELIESKLGEVVGFVGEMQIKFMEAMQAKDSQYLAAFKEHMTAMTVQLEKMRREVS